jgi:hypothetical protein
MAENASPGTADVVLAWQRGDGPGRVEFVVTSSHAEELLGLLAEEEISAAPDPRQVRGVGADVLTTVVTVAENPAAWAAVGLAVKTFFDRHKGKRIRVDEDGLTEAANYSARDIERIIRALSDTDPDDADERR